MRGQRASGQTKALWPEPYSTDALESARRFVYECCWTFHEQLLTPQPIGRKEYIDWIIWHWFDTRQRGEQLVIWKPRRVLVSWVLRALELWSFGLAPSEHLVAGEVYASAQRHVWRYHYLYNQIRDRFTWGLGTDETTGSGQAEGGIVKERSLTSVFLPNGALARAINSDPNALYGDGVRGVTLEEPHTYLHLYEMISQAALLTQSGQVFGAAKVVNGHVVLVGNTAHRRDWIDTIKKESEWEGRDAPPPPFRSSVYLNEFGTRVLDISYLSDPEKTEAWAISERPRVPNWDVEMEKNYDVKAGDAIIQSFSMHKHCPKRMQEDAWAPCMSRYSDFVLGIDTGTQARYHAGTLLEVRPGESARDRQIIAVKEFVLTDKNGRPRPSDFMEFARFTLNWLESNLPSQYWGAVEWVADSTITTQSGVWANADLMSVAARELRTWNARGEYGPLRIRPMSNDWNSRLNAVNQILLEWIDEDPRFFINGHDCPCLLKALQGAYCYREPTAVRGENADMREPDKNVWSHVAESLQYGSMRAIEILRKQAKLQGVLR